MISALQNFNNGIKQIRSTNNHGSGLDQFIIQRFIPSKEEYPLVYRGLWKRNKGFKFYKMTSLFPYNGDKSLIVRTSPNS